MSITARKENIVPSAESAAVKIQYAKGDFGGTTSIRYNKQVKTKPNPYPENTVTIYRQGRFKDTEPVVDRDLGQTFIPSEDFTLQDLYLRIGPNGAGVGANTAPVAIQFFEVKGVPKLNNNGTEGFTGKFNWATSPELDDFLEGETFHSMAIIGGQFPDSLKALQYLKFSLNKEISITFKKGKHYAFLLMFLEPAEERQLSLFNSYYGTYQPDTENPYLGHGFRREGRPQFPRKLSDRSKIAPTTFGFPDVCTYRDLFFTLTGR